MALGHRQGQCRLHIRHVFLIVSLSDNFLMKLPSAHAWFDMVDDNPWEVSIFRVFSIIRRIFSKQQMTSYSPPRRPLRCCVGIVSLGCMNQRLDLIMLQSLALHSINMLHKSHSTLNKYPTMHHFVTEMCTWVHIYVTNGALWSICSMYCGVCEMALFNVRDELYVKPV